MKKVWKQCIMTFMGLLCFCLLWGSAVPAQAATVKRYKKYVQKNLIPKYGKAKTGSYKIALNYLTEWCTRKGVLSVYTTDFNSDGKKECIVLYLKNNFSYGYNLKELRMASLVTRNGKIRVQHDIFLENMDGMLTQDARVYVKTYKKKKYIVFQNIAGVDSPGNNIYVLRMDSRGYFHLKLGLSEPGVSGAPVSLYRLSSNGIINSLADLNKTFIFQENEWTDVPIKSKTFARKVNNALKKYGLSVSASKTSFGGRNWLLKKNANMKLLCSIKNKIRFSNGKFRFTVSIKDYT